MGASGSCGEPSRRHAFETDGERYGPARSIQSGIGALEVRRPKVRDRAADVTAEKKICFSSGKREGWKEQGVFAVSLDDQRLTWPERELVRQLGERLYGARPSEQEVQR